MGLESAADQIIQAINAKDSKSLAAAIRAAFTILDSEEEQPESSDEDHSYDSQNAKAAQSQKE